MEYLTVKALHLVGVISWYAGLFYMPRLLIYDVEANARPAAERDVLQAQLRLMARRLWFGITWPAMLFTLVFGTYLVVLYGQWERPWLHAKLALVALLVVYHAALGRLRAQVTAGTCRWGSTRLRLWNEVATVHMLVTVLVASRKDGAFEADLWLGILAVVAALVAAVFLYRRLRRGPAARPG